MDRLVSLHRHDSYSFYDGVDVAARAAKRAASLGQPALALTNHGNVYGLIDHYRACDEAGIKPILGCEFYVVAEYEREPDGEDEAKVKRVRPAHITVLADSLDGYRNLMRLTAEANQHFYYKPRISLSLLEHHKAGLIVLSGCPSGLVGKAIAADYIPGARRIFERMASAFRGQFYGEVQHHENGAKLARFVDVMSERLGVPVVATGDAHYTEPEDKVVHDLILKMRQYAKGKGEENPSYGTGYHIMDRQEFDDILRARHSWADAAKVGRWLDATVEIADRCSLKLERPARVLPALWGDDASRILTDMARRGLAERGLQLRGPYRDRLERELKVILDKGLAEYFLTVQDVVGWAKSQGIAVGPRGSVCGSLLAYAIGVTAIDPLVHGTIFERFMHEQKKALPDVDLDFDARKRDEVVAYVQKRFEGYAIPISSFGRYAAGQLAKDLARAVEMSDKNAAALKEVLDGYRKEHLVSLDEEKLSGSATIEGLSEEYPWLKRAISKLFGQVRYMGKHPGGVCFVPDKSDPYRWLAPLVDQKTGRSYTPYSMYDVDYLGLVKFDFLGLDALTTIVRTIETVKERHGTQIDVDAIPLDDPQVFRAVTMGATDGIFQLEERGAKAVSMEVEPDSFRELVAVISLNRPGVSDQIARYVAGKQSGDHSGKGVLSDTYGALVYQEQVMTILKKLGLPWADIDKFLKAIKTAGSFSIGKSVRERQPMRPEIVALMKNRGYDEEAAQAFVDRLSGYYFNRAHATGYARTSYIMGWLRTHYPLEFWSARLDAEGVEYKRLIYEKCAVGDGIPLLPPHVNGSAGYSVEANAIRVGMSSIKGVGEKALEAIVKSQPYKNPNDVVRRIPRRQLNKKIIAALYHAGALEFDRDKMVKRAIDYNKSRRWKREEDDDE